MSTQELETKLQTLRDPRNQTSARSVASPAAVEALSELIAAVEANEIAVTPEGDLVGTINKRIAALDQEVNEGLNEVMHNDSFCKLEASWRGLHYLVSSAETGTMLKLRLLNATKDEIQKEILKSSRV